MEQERTEERDGRNRVTHGIHDIQMEGLAGQTLAEARGVLEAMLNVPEDARVLADGEPIDEDHKIRSGEVLEFVQFAGKKGSHALAGRA